MSGSSTEVTFPLATIAALLKSTETQMILTKGKKWWALPGSNRRHPR
ncbi:hypothetical protein PSCLAVI8L_130470 [Pseudoclavibacter sp. 8L]|nr:hypothetical protein PSCLAVI8L_130470 [Pseudoclavibacter sp. 8L]